MDISRIQIHDSTIISVTEDTKSDNYTFLIDWCNVSGNGPYINAELIFKDVTNYNINETPFEGSPVILEILELNELDDSPLKRRKYKVETNAGYRSLFCRDVILIEDNQKKQNEQGRGLSK